MLGVTQHVEDNKRNAASNGIQPVKPGEVVKNHDKKRCYWEVTYRNQEMEELLTW
jgi:hypothetical protein